MDANQKVCPKCENITNLLARKDLKLFDNKNFELIETPLPKDDPLNFVDKKKYTIV